MTEFIDTIEKASYTLQGRHLIDPPAGEVLMDDPCSLYFDRAMGFYTEDLRQKFIDSSARIAGCGGGGATLAVMLAKEGVGDFSIADIETVEPSNVGRIPIFTPDDVGRPKADVVAELITQHNPTAEVRVYSEGVQEHNVDEFLGYDAKNRGLTVGFDEIEITEPHLMLMYHRTARRFGRFVICATDIERGGMVTTFDPNDLEHTFEHSTGGRPDQTAEEYNKKITGFQLPTIPNIPLTTDFQTLLATQKKGVSLPTALRSVFNATDLAMDEFEKLLTLGDKRYGKPHFYPEVHCVNPSQGEDFVTKRSRLVSTMRVLRILARNTLGLNPSASYSDKQRQARVEYRTQVASNL